MAEGDANVPDSGRRRRMVNRRGAGMAFSGNGLSQSSSGSGVAAVDEDPDLNEAVEQAARTPPARVAPRPEAVDPEAAAGMAAIAGTEEFNPASRMAQVQARSSEYAREYRLGLLHRMLLRNLPQDEIAAQLGISVRQVQRDMQDLKARLRESAKQLDVDLIIGNSKGFYEEVQAMAMRAASNGNVPMPMRLAAMRTALASHNDMHRFYQAAGVYDVLRFKKGAGEGAQSDIQRLMSLTEDLLADARKDQRDTGNPLGNFSGDDRENMEL